jgi:hypothetical protein
MIINLYMKKEMYSVIVRKRVVKKK